MDELKTSLERLLLWAKHRKESETSLRSDVNIHKRTLVETWDQIIAKLEQEIKSL